MKVKEIISLLELNFPITDACKWDYTGWQVQANDLNLEINKLLIALDINNQVVQEAIKSNINLIICHHPFFFDIQWKDLKHDNWKYHIYQSLIENNINVYVIHTNFDKSIKGMNMLMANDLKFSNIKYFNEEQLAVMGNYNNLSLLNIIEDIKTYFNCEKVKIITNNLNNKIKHVVLSAGAGGQLIHELDNYSQIKESNILFVTGEIKWHQQVEAMDKNINVIIVDHIMEEKFVDFISNFLNENNKIKAKIKIKKFLFKKSFFI